jgi:hypothetical protein
MERRTDNENHQEIFDFTAGIVDAWQYDGMGGR